jgi:hypothetical protein
MLVNKLRRFAGAFDKHGERVEPSDQAIHLNTPGQVNRYRDIFFSYLIQEHVLKIDCSCHLAPASEIIYNNISHGIRFAVTVNPKQARLSPKPRHLAFGILSGGNQSEMHRFVQ